MKIKFGLGLVGILCASQPAQADWQYTKWGMSPEAAAAASKGALSLDEGLPGDRMDGYSVGATGTYAAGSRRFRAVLYFKDRALSLIHLSTDEKPRCYALANDLKGVYGKPFDSSENAITVTNTWQDKTHNNFVALLAIGDDCSLTYKPLVSKDASGL